MNATLEELTVKLIPESGFILHITARSTDAILWTQNKAPQFGELFPTGNWGVYRLYVDLSMDTQDVIDTLNQYLSMGD